MGFLVELTKDLIPTDIAKYFSLVSVAVALVAFVICLLAKGSKKSKFADYCGSVSDYIASAGVIDDSNLDDFNAKCFSENAPAAVKQGWDAFLEERFGYPSDQFDKSACLAPVKAKSGLAGFYLFLSSVGFFIAAGFANSDKQTLAAFATVPAAAFFFWLLSASTGKGAAKKAAVEAAAFNKLLEDLDASVQLQQLFDYERDTEDLEELSAAIDEIAEYENSKQPKPKAAPAPVEEEEEFAEEEVEAVEEYADEEEEIAEEEYAEEEIEEEVEPEPIEPEFVEEEEEEIIPEPIEPEYIEEEEVVEEVEEEVEEEIEPEPIEPEVEPEPIEPEYFEEEEVEEEADEVEPEPIESEYVEEEEVEEEEEEFIPEPIEPEYVEPEEVAPAPVAEPAKPTVDFKAFHAVLNAALGKGYNKATMKKLGTIIVMAFKKFDEPEQREALKGCIKKFIKMYPKSPD